LESVDSEEVSYTPPFIDDSDDAPAISHDEYTDGDNKKVDADGNQGNLALNKVAVASSVEHGGVAAVKSVDGDASTRWSSAFVDDAWIRLDLGSVQTIDRVRLNWEAAYGKRYNLQVSNDATNWTTVYTESNGNGGIDDITIGTQRARYVRMQGLQRGTQWGYSLFEFEVYGDVADDANSSTSSTEPPATDTTETSSGERLNLALNKVAVASSVEHGGVAAVKSVDGDASTRWSSAFVDDAWIRLDLGSVQTIDRVRLNWEAAYGKRYNLQVSNDATNWTTVYTESNGNGGIDDITIGTQRARYVRMQGLQRGTQWGYSLFEFEVYGDVADDANSSTSSTEPPATDTTETSSGERLNLALNKVAVASSVEHGGVAAVKSVDGDASTRWSSAFVDDAWIRLDLGSVQTIDRVSLNWEAAYGKRYNLQVSNDATTWTTVYTESNGNGGIDDISIGTQRARYVRMQGLQRGTQWGYSLFEFEVYGESASSTEMDPPVSNDSFVNDQDFDGDNDGMPDEWEERYGLNPVIDDAGLDADGDGVSNLVEYEIQSDPTTYTDNFVPDAPEIAAVDETDRVGLTPVLVSGAYFDPDDDDHHLSQWQISTESNFASLIMDLTTQYHLTAFTVGEMVLDADTRYYWRVRYIDSRDGQSAWSQPSNFTTLTADQTDDSNADGIPDAQAVDQAVDLNRNGVPDILEANMMSVNTVEGQSVVSIQGMSDDFSLVSLKSLPSDAISDQSVKLEFGLIGFKIYLHEGVNTATLNVYFSEPLEDGADPYKYSADTGWTIYEDVIFSPDRKRVTLTLVDGGNGDEDGVENGVIVDCFGIARVME
jgi:hypothetical protein